MNKNKKSNLAIWKIDRNESSLTGLSSKDTILAIVESWNSKDGIRTNEILNPVSLSRDSIDDKHILIYHKKRISGGLRSFLQNVIENTENQNIFSNTNNDFLCFVFDDNDVFLITAGAGYHAIQKFIDENFPLEVAKKIFTGDFNHAEMRGLTGVTYSKSENYRRNYTFSRQESFGKIWKKLSGRIDQDVIKNSPELSLVIDPTKKLNGEMKSSFTFRKSVTFDEVITLINALQALPEIGEEKAEKFKFLDTLREIKDKPTRDKLKNKLLQRLFLELTTEPGTCDFDFCHPSKPVDFFTGCSYKINDNDLDSEDYPTTEAVISYIQQNNLVDLSSFDQFKASFEKLNLSFLKEDTDSDVISSDLVKCFHGEISLDNKCYFFIDGKWYETLGTFLENLLNDFIFEVFQDGTSNPFLSTEIPLLKWSANDKGRYIESEYNKLQSEQENFYHGDMIYVFTDKGKIELFDLLYLAEGKLYILQVKNGFDTAMRNACSQIELAAEIIEQDVKSGTNVLKRYYLEWQKNSQNNLNETDFLNLFINAERIYVLACSAGQPFTLGSFKEGVLFSNIAQYETLGLKHLFKGKGYSLKLQNIEK